MAHKDQTPTSLQSIARVETAIEHFRKGGLVIMSDDEGRENEGDLVFAAEFADPERINFMAKEARGLICLSLTHEVIDKFNLPMMEHSGAAKDKKSTAFTVSIEARDGVTTGISAADRARTIKVAIDPKTQPEELVVPGHVFPLKARPGGVLERAGHTEGSVDLARLSKLQEAAVICEIMNDDGTMARGADLLKFSQKFDLPMISIADLIQYRLMRESLVEKIGEKHVTTSHGQFRSHIFKSVLDNSVHTALTVGDESFAEEVAEVRVHSQRPYADVFGDSLNGPRFRIEYGLNMLRNSSQGVFLYLSSHDGEERIMKDVQEMSVAKEDLRGEFEDTSSPMDLRLYGIGAQILAELGVKKMCIHTTQPRTLKGLGGFGLTVVDQKAMITKDNQNSTV